jgi:DNA-directed RNA polymerase specialized sigma24 family protein
VLDRLDVKLRLAFTLHALDGRPLAQVAELMGASVMATKTRVWRARRVVEKQARRDPHLAEFLQGTEPEGTGDEEA